MIRVRALVTAALVLAAAGLGLGPAPAEATSPGINGTIAFVRSGGLFTVGGGGTGERDLGVATTAPPSWNADGTLLGYATEDGQFATADPDGTNVALRSATAGDFPVLSPDGTRLLFTRLSEETSDDIVISDLDGSDEVVIAREGTELLPAWSPDGAKIAFQATHDDAFRIWIMNADGSDAHEIPDQPAGSSWLPRFSPDGSKLVFTNDPASDDAVFQLHVVGVDGSGLTPVGPSNRYSLPGGFSPDGEKLLYSSHAPHYETDPATGLYVMDIDGTDAVQITQGDDDWAAWQPVVPQPPRYNGKLVYTRWGDNAQPMMTVNADGTSPAPIARFGLYPSFGGGSIAFWDGENIVVADAETYATKASFPWATTPFWLKLSPDGKRLLWANYAAKPVMFVSDVDGTNQHHVLSDPAEDGVEFAWGPDSASMLYVASDGLKRVNLDGSNVRLLRAIPDTHTAIEGPTMSADGTKLMFTMGLIDGDLDPMLYRLYVANADGTNAQPITAPTGRTIGCPTFSPDGRKIAFGRHDNGDPQGIVVMDVDGSNSHQITFGDHECPSWQTLSSEPANLAPRAFGTAQNKLPLALLASAAPSFDIDGTIVRYEWRWGDNTAMSPNKYVWHKYAKPGTYLVRLTVVDDDGARTTRKAWVKVT